MTQLGRPVFSVGTLTIRGERFSFAPGEARAFQVSPGGDFEVALVYAYEEVSADREEAAVRFSAALGGRTLGSREATMEDAPVVKDAERGTLALAAKAPRSGEVEGSFRVEAGYSRSPWGSAGPAQGKAFERSGTFRVVVK